ncbi:MAG: response regulator [Candidatus Delongbacteria bacterium]|nr:response regulator [Candidatus Delongbacteria bacterium]MBN2833802.1 response regulator [Candidatus Delongbacteria bacterium]
MEKNEMIKELTKDLSILHVDDEEMILDLFQFVLENFFLVSDTAKDGEEALKKFKEKKYDIVLTDLDMPKMNGLVLSEKLQEMDSTLPILVLSAYVNNSIAIKLEAKNIFYLKKPVTNQILIEKIYDILKKD